jgi:hypothetical protein
MRKFLVSPRHKFLWVLSFLSVAVIAGLRETMCITHDAGYAGATFFIIAYTMGYPAMGGYPVANTYILNTCVKQILL